MDTTDKVKCKHCGKYISREEDQENESGSYCRHLRDEGWDDQALKEHRLKWTVTEIPLAEEDYGTIKKGTPYIKVAALDKMCKRLGIPVARMVRAMGGDRSLEGPLHKKFQPYYVGRARYVHPWCMSEEGLDYLRGLGRGTVPTKDAPAKKGSKKTVSVKAPAEVKEMAEVLS